MTHGWSQPWARLVPIPGDIPDWLSIPRYKILSDIGVEEYCKRFRCERYTAEVMLAQMSGKPFKMKKEVTMIDEPTAATKRMQEWRAKQKALGIKVKR